MTKVSKLSGSQLDWAVASIECDTGWLARHMHLLHTMPYSTDWAQGGPIVEREAMCISRTNKTREEPWAAYIAGYYWVDGPTPLIAAMRCLVASKLGDDIEVPEELL